MKKSTTRLFQNDDFTEDFGEIETRDTLAQAREAWNIPTLAQMRRAALGDRARVPAGWGELQADRADLGRVHLDCKQGPE